MTEEKPRRFFPDRLQAVPERWTSALRIAWLAVLAFAVTLDVAGAAFVLHDFHKTRPLFTIYGISHHIGEHGEVLVSPLGSERTAIGIAEDSRIAAIDGQPLAPDLLIADVVPRLMAVQGRPAIFTLVSPEGRAQAFHLAPSPRHERLAEQDTAIAFSTRMMIRLGLSFFSCLALIGCATLLFMRRSRDPVALLLSFGFLLLAAVIDPPLMMWLGLGFGTLYNFVSTAGWVPIFVGLAAFPDGRFKPGWMRYTVPVAIPLAIALVPESINPWLQLVVGIALPLLVIVGQVVRYRRLDQGIERQQIKWAAFGFGTGIVLIGVSIGLAMALDRFSGFLPALMVLTLFNLGLIAMPLGLLVSLLRFRLWEADRLIGRSAAYAAITVFIGIIWAASTDLVKDFVISTMGEGKEAVATTLSAVLAVGLFSPTQAVVLGWTERHFNKEVAQLQALAARLGVWRATDEPADLARRAMAIICENVHCSRSTLLVHTPDGAETLARHEAEGHSAIADDHGPGLDLALHDDGLAVGLLRLGPRSDGNRYNRQQVGALQSLREPLAEAIRFSRRRVARERAVDDALHRLEQRLAGLERALSSPSSAER